MHASLRSTYVAALLLSGLGLPAVLAVQGILSPVGYAAVTTVLISLAVIVKRTDAMAYIRTRREQGARS